MAKRKPKTGWDKDPDSPKNRYKLKNERERQIIRSKNPPAGDLGKHSVPGKIYQQPGRTTSRYYLQPGEPQKVGESQSKKFKPKRTVIYTAKDLPKNSMLSRYGRLTGGGSAPGRGMGQGGSGGGGFLKRTK